MQNMLPTTPFNPHTPPTLHEPINDLPVHRATMPQRFEPVAESAHFSRTDAGKVFDQTLLPADVRIPHPQLIAEEKDRRDRSLEDSERQARKLQRAVDEVKEKERKERAKARYERRTTQVIKNEEQVVREGDGSGRSRM